MYDTLYSAFADAMKRESKVITSYNDNTAYNVLFRVNKDTNQLQDKKTIYYPADNGIHAGQLLQYKDKIYLTINQESSENEIYQKSDMLQTNAILNYIADGLEYNIPAYAYDVQSALAIGSSTISLVSGNIKIITEDSDTTRALKLNDKFYAIGGYWKIDNLIYKDNVVTLYVERYASSAVYSLTINADTSYDKGELVQFTATAKEDETIVKNPTIIWKSSDTSKATIDNNGMVKFLDIGDVIITATWKEHNVTESCTVTVKTPAVYALVINGEDSYTTKDTPTLTATATKDGEVVSTATITWESKNTEIATIDSTGKVTFLSDGEVIISATWMEQNITATKNIIVSAPAAGYTCEITNTKTPPEPYDDTTNPIQIKVGGTKKPLVVHFYDGSSAEVTLTPAWSLSDLTPQQQSAVHLTYNESYPNRCYLNCDDISSLIGSTFKLVVTDVDGQATPCTRIVQIISFT